MAALVRKNEIVFVSGRTGTGKSQLLYDLFVSRAPRVLSLDVNGEVAERNPDAIEARGWTRVVAALRAVAPYPQWHIAAVIEEEHFDDLVNLLIPPMMADDQTGYARAVGGMALECGELDVLAPVHSASRTVTGMWRRARHNRLSIFGGTQRTNEVARVCSSQAHHIIAFAQNEPNDIAYLAKAISRPGAELVERLPLHWCVWFERSSGRLYVMDPGRNVVKTVSTWGFEIDPADDTTDGFVPEQQELDISG